MLKNDRGDMKSIAGKVIRNVGTLLFDTESYPEFLIWIGTLYQQAPKKNVETRADLVFTVYFIVGFVSKRDAMSTDCDAENVLKSLKWIVDVIPSASITVYNQCLKGIVLVANTFPKISEDYFEPTILAICSNLPDFNTHDKNFELLIDTISKFSDFFAAKPEFAEEIVQIVRPDTRGFKNVRELKRRMKLTMAVVKMAKSRQLLDATNGMISEMSQKCEDNGGKWSSAAMITIICDVFNELLILGKNDESLREGVEESLSQVLKELNFSKQNTKEKQAFFNSLAKIVTQLPVESPIKTRVHEIVFDEKTGLFFSENRDNRIFCHNTIYKDLINLISVLLRPTSLNHLQATYTDLRRIMIDSMSRLKRSEIEPQSDVIRWHESILLLFFSSLQEISCAKSSLIVMMGIRPSIFEFFTKELPLTEYWLPSNHPHVYHLFVTILYGHLKAHDFYMSQSDYLLRGDSSPIGQTKRDYAQKQVIALQKIISTFGEKLWKRTRLLISSWLYSLVAAACEQNIGAESFRSKEWVRLRSTLIHQSMLLWNNESISQALTSLSTVTKWPDLPMEIERDITEKTKKSKWKDAAAIWEAGDCNVYVRQSMWPVIQMQQERQQKFIFCDELWSRRVHFDHQFLAPTIVPTTFKKGEK
uniref:Uncharacterized protein n=1 Tax=Caenorhabditis japonica TaxID=281687 RepID=A0A8R1E8N5_CAEJA